MVALRLGILAACAKKVVAICWCDQSELSAIHEGLVTMAKDWIAPKTFGRIDQDSKSISQSDREFNSNFNLDNHDAQLGLRAPRERWYSRGYLPHRDDVQQLQSITFRLADSLPSKKLLEIEEELKQQPVTQRAVARRKRIEQWLDSGAGCCALQHPRLAQILEETLLKFDGIRYSLIAWCVMPNHVHTLIQPISNLANIVKSWKSFTGRWALVHNNELGLQIATERLWMHDYWDRYVRDPEHLQRLIEYIH